MHNPRDETHTSSQTSRTAATLGSSSGSIPPPGMIHLSGYLLLLTNNTCEETFDILTLTLKHFKVFSLSDWTTVNDRTIYRPGQLIMGH